MKDMFPEYDNGRSPNYSEVWKDAVFVFDTNVLLNLYRYRVRTRNELLDVLHEISDRIWIPYQVALEFQRNRLSVIAEQVKRFNEVRNSVNRAKENLTNDLAKFKLQERHSLINTEPLIKGFDKEISKFFDGLSIIEKDQQTIFDEDELKARLENLFNHRVGRNFSNQSDLDVVQKSGEQRYKYKIPPGYEDDLKDSKEPDEFFHSGLIYKRKYGDLILWKQILSYCRESEKKSLIFITDDAKSDWWRIVEQDGPKIIGPRPELIDEARNEGGIQNFLMYRPDRFLEYAKSELEAKISSDSIQEVKDLSETIKKAGRKAVEDAMYAREIFKKWVSDRYNNSFENSSKTGHIVLHEGEKYLFIPAIYSPTIEPIDIYQHTVALYAGSIFGNDPDSEKGRVCVFWLAPGNLEASKIRMSLTHSKGLRDSGDLGFDVIIAIADGSGVTSIASQLTL
jgi:hypothetical protein